MRNDGVTLVELIIVIAIIGIIVLFATIDTAWFQRDARLTEVRDRLLADIENVKLKSITGVPHAIFVVGTTSYRAVRLTDAAGSDFKRDTTDTEADGDIITVANFTSPTLPSNMRLRWSNGTEIWFDRKGTPRSSTWGFTNGTFTIWYDTETVNNSPDSNEQQKEIVISQDGRIQYEKR